ncbi:MAG: T9SS type A sorting domain-containing protein [Bacteroidales bacterium]|nr:T9SS type A sorting domain-containing protein [Bacteroidales bacterium]
MNNTNKIYVITVLFLIIPLLTNAQITKRTADSLVLNNSILLGRLDSVNVFSKTNILSNSDSIVLFGGEILHSFQEENWLYFIDLHPFSEWMHQCCYIFVDKNSGMQYTYCTDAYPIDIHKDYQILSSMCEIENIISDSIYNKAEADSTLYAVLINGCSDRYRFWGDLSNVYNTLVNIYGFPKDHIYVHSRGFTSIHEYPTLNIQNPYSLDADSDSEINYPDTKNAILGTFNEMAGITDTIYEIPKLTNNDRLFIFVTDHGDTCSGKSLVYLGFSEYGGSYETMYDYEFADWIRPIECGQMTILMQQCYSGGFIDDISDTTNVKCKNRVIHTSTDDSHVSKSEFFITAYKGVPDSYRMDEFTYYWCAAASGYYANPSTPWKSLGTTGSFDFSKYFKDTGHPVDYHPDINNDGYLQLEEIFSYANDFDVHSEYGFCFLPALEIPTKSFGCLFSQKFETMLGCSGVSNLNDTISTMKGSVYNLLGDIYITGNSALISNGVTFKNKKNYRIEINGNIDIKNSKIENVEIFLNQIVDGKIPTISQCKFENYNVETGIEIKKCNNFSIINNDISAHGNGIQIYYSGNGVRGRQKIIGNTIHDCKSSGILIYNSTCEIKMNKICNNSFGIRSLNSSTITSMRGNLNAFNANETQKIYNSDRIGLYVTENSFPIELKYNAIYNENNYNDTLVMYDGSFSYIHSARNTIYDITNNFWGSDFDSLVNLHATTGVSFNVAPLWIMDGGVNQEYPPIDMFNDANTLFECGLFNEAEEKYRQIVNLHPSTIYAILSMKEMLRLEHYTSNDFHNLKKYFLTDNTIVTDTTLCMLGMQLANKCDEIIGNYDASIKWYGNIIVNHKSPIDSIFAVIDLENLYLEMSNDKFNDKRNTFDIKREQLKSYEKNRNILLSKLPIKNNEIKSNELCKEVLNDCHQVTIYPNPMDNYLNITMQNDNKIKKISLYRLSGELIISIIGDRKQIIVPDIKPGIYIVAIETDLGEIQYQKILKK